MVWGSCGSYCENLSDSQALQQPYHPNVYKDYSCVLNINQVFNILLLEWIVYFILAVYFDNVFANENGVRRRPWYFLMPNYWMPVARGNARHKARIDTRRCGSLCVLPCACCVSFQHTVAPGEVTCPI